MKKLFDKLFIIAKVLILIPYMILITEIFLFISSLFCAYFNINSSSYFFMLYFYLILFTTYPCFICSVIGFVLTIILMRIDKPKSKKIILVGVFSILISILLYLWNTWHLSAMMSV